MSFRSIATSVFVALWMIPDSDLPRAYGEDCIYHAVVRPTGRIRPTDNVRIDVRIITNSYPTILEQPTTVTQNGNSFLIELYASAGLAGTYDQLILPLDLGTLAPGTYGYSVNQHANNTCSAEIVQGSFCVDTADCTEETCTCPVFCPAYTIEPLGAMEYAYAVNDLGQVAGRHDSPGAIDAAMWDGSQMILIPAPGEQEALAINNAGQVVGWWPAFRWFNGTLSYLPSISGGESGAHGINEAGEIVGYSGGGWPAHWFNGTVTNLATSIGFVGRARDINNLGHIVGGRSFWDGQSLTMLSPHTTGFGMFGTWAVAINDFDQIVGRTGDFASPDQWGAFLWHNGSMVDLAAELGANGVYSEAVAINNHGEIVGNPEFLRTSDGVMLRLRDLIATDSGWYDLEPTGINNLGQICGHTSSAFTGEAQRAFLMTPNACAVVSVPTASNATLVIMVAGMVVAGAVVVRQARRSAVSPERAVT